MLLNGVTISGGSVNITATVSGAETPSAPTIGTVTQTVFTSGNLTASIPFTAPTNDGGSAITSYIATSIPGNLTGTLSQAVSGTITVTGLTTATAYSFVIQAINAIGISLASNASNSITTETAPATAEYLVVAGGGSGGDHRTAGGGAGGLLYYGAITAPKTPNGAAIAFVGSTAYVVSVSGVAGANASGSNSSVVGGAISIVATGGGAWNQVGGSGGGGGKLGVTGQGSAGGTPAGGGNNSSAGGGGGAGGIGNNSSGNAGGAGGIGLQYSAFAVLTGANAGQPTGTVTGGYFAGGGGGGGFGTGAGSGGNGGIGGGGAGGYGPYGAAYGASGSWGNPGAINTGGGGGGGSDLHSSNGNASKGFGASGIVIIAYQATRAWATGGTINSTTRSGWYLHIFTGSGTFTTL